MTTQLDRIALAGPRRERRWLVRDRDKSGLPPDHAVAAGLLAELEAGRIESVAFVVGGDVSWPLPLYEVAIATARRGWRLGLPAARYWLITPEPQPLAALGAAMTAFAYERLGPEGITFIGSTYAHVQGGAVLLDPRDEHIHADRIVTLGAGSLTTSSAQTNIAASTRSTSTITSAGRPARRAAARMASGEDAS